MHVPISAATMLADLTPPVVTWEQIESTYKDLPEPAEGEKALLDLVEAIEAQLARVRVSVDDCRELDGLYPRAWVKAVKTQGELTAIPQNRLTRRPEPRFSEAQRQAHGLRLMELFDRASNRLLDLCDRYFQQTGMQLGMSPR